ncbi:capsid completion protein, partial [Escherichia coli P4-96]
SGEGTVVIPQPAGDEPVIKNTFFFPDIDPKRVRERMRLEQTVAPARPSRRRTGPLTYVRRNVRPNRNGPTNGE